MLPCYLFTIFATELLLLLLHYQHKHVSLLLVDILVSYLFTYLLKIWAAVF